MEKRCPFGKWHQNGAPKTVLVPFVFFFFFLSDKYDLSKCIRISHEQRGLLTLYTKTLKNRNRKRLTPLLNGLFSELNHKTSTQFKLTCLHKSLRFAIDRWKDWTSLWLKFNSLPQKDFLFWVFFFRYYKEK